MSEHAKLRRVVAGVLLVGLGTTACGSEPIDSKGNTAATNRELQPRTIAVATMLLTMAANPNFDGKPLEGENGHLTLQDSGDGSKQIAASYLLSTAAFGAEVRAIPERCKDKNSAKYRSLRIIGLMDATPAGQPDPTKVTDFAILRGSCLNGFQRTHKTSVHSRATIPKNLYEPDQVVDLWNTVQDYDTNNPAEIAKEQAFRAKSSQPFSTEILNIGSADVDPPESKKMYEQDMAEIEQLVGSASTLTPEDLLFIY